MNALLYETVPFSPQSYYGGPPLTEQLRATAASGFDGVVCDRWSVEHHLADGGDLDEIVGLRGGPGGPGPLGVAA